MGENLKKITIFVLIIWGAWFIYIKYISPVIKPFFEKNKDKVDFFSYR